MGYGGITGVVGRQKGTKTTGKTRTFFSRPVPSPWKDPGDQRSLLRPHGPSDTVAGRFTDNSPDVCRTQTLVETYKSGGGAGGIIHPPGRLRGRVQEGFLKEGSAEVSGG